MKKNALFCILWVFCAYWAGAVWAQYPQYFSYDDESGLPSNEVYSLAQDTEGFLWLGCDAGLYKFDGLSYRAYKSPTQKLKSITGLTLSASGRLYCYNFQGQIFFVENDSLKELPANFQKVTGMSADKQGNLFANDARGVSSYNEYTQQWTAHHIKQIQAHEDPTCSIAQSSSPQGVYLVSWAGFGKIESDASISINACEFFRPVGIFVMERWRDEIYVFSAYTPAIYHIKEGKARPLEGTKLNAALRDKKVTNARTLPDGDLWICTYSGMVRYTPQSGAVEVFYPDLSFSDCLIDREGNYWFSTLQAGMIRIPELNWRVWNREHEQIRSERLTKIASNGENVYFASVDGAIGSLNTSNQALKTVYLGANADPQSFDFDAATGSLLVNINKRLFCLRKDQLSEIPNEFLTLKSLKTVDTLHFIATSFGTFVGKSLLKSEMQKRDNRWARAIVADSAKTAVWVVSNGGLLKFERRNEQWTLTHTFHEGTQMLAATFDEQEQRIYCINVSGKLSSINNNNQTQALAQLPEGVLVYKLAKQAQKIYLATNKGLWILDLQTSAWTNLNALSGIASNNLQDLTIAQNCLWLATGKGLQKIPLSDRVEKPLARIFLHRIKIGENYTKPQSDLQINYWQRLQLHPETLIYNSNGSFKYAYRINSSDNPTWYTLPASSEGISISNLPYGTFEIELKAIDHLGRDSENCIILRGFAAPPFWKSRLFYALLLLFSVLLCILISGIIIRHIRNKELLKTSLINSRLEATQAQIKAIRAQMNPHFMYNALSSIQALILKQDIKNSNLYLSKFSSLLRKVLEASTQEEISLQEDIDVLALYLSLEKLRFGDDFEYEIRIDEEVDSYNLLVPPLLLQPFVENALKHGLLHKKGSKNLLISYHIEAENLCCRVKDNGIGRENAQKILDKRPETHRSFSTKASSEQVTLLSSFKNRQYSISIHDLQDETGAAEGTEVLIRLPLG